jgi:hypothetical protein
MHVKPLVLVVALAACGPAPSASAPGPTSALGPTRAPDATEGPRSPATASIAPVELPARLPIATSPRGFSGGDALAGGTLGVETTGSMTCFYLAAPGDSKTALVWPYGFSAGGTPVAVLGPDGQRLAQAGDIVTLGGGAPPPGYVPADIQDPCGFGSLFWVSSVASVNGHDINIGEGSLQLTIRSSGAPADCPGLQLEPLMLVMVNEHLQLRVVSSGVDLEASWPVGYRTATDPIRVLDAKGSAIAVQGREVTDLIGTRSDGGISVCGRAGG